MRTVRILVTGWRHWPERDKLHVWRALNDYRYLCEAPARFVVVHGQCPYGGADLWAEQWAMSRGYLWEPHPANWRQFGKPAGNIRNTEMVELGADVCMAFPGPMGRGTIDCMEKARRAGIPVLETKWGSWLE